MDLKRLYRKARWGRNFPRSVKKILGMGVHTSGGLGADHDVRHSHTLTSLLMKTCCIPLCAYIHPHDNPCDYHVAGFDGLSLSDLVAGFVKGVFGLVHNQWSPATLRAVTSISMGRLIEDCETLVAMLEDTEVLDMENRCCPGGDRYGC